MEWELKVAGESLHLAEENHSEHMRKGEACLWVSETPGSSAGPQECSATPRDGGSMTQWLCTAVYVLVLALTPGSATSWLGGPDKSLPWFLRYICRSCFIELIGGQNA